MTPPRHPDALAPERSHFVESHGARIHLSEWGDPQATPLLLCHGMFDHGRGFDLLAPYLAEHFRVVALDARGHGESGWVDSYAWMMDVYDIVNVLGSLGRPAHLLGHSKGGGQATDAATIAPELVLKLVNIDGFGPPSDEGFRQRPDMPDTLAGRFGMYLDRRRNAKHRSAWRAYSTLDELTTRRAEQNPRLDRQWIDYFAYHAAREDEDGWRWKADPQMVAGGFGPFKPEFIGPGWARLERPMLAIIGSVPDEWGPLPEPLLEERLGHVRELERATVEGSGHFVHMEHPRETALLLHAYLGERFVKLQNGRVELILHRLRDGGELPPLLLLHALGSDARQWDEAWLDWEGPVHALDFSGHGESARVAGGGYVPEIFAADADLALEAIGDPAVVVGAGVGAYAALLLAGGRPTSVRATALLPGRGLAAGAARPDFEPAYGLAERTRRIDEASSHYQPDTDPAVWSCEVDLRPPEYASEFATAAHGLLFADAIQPEDPGSADAEGLAWWWAAREASAGLGVASEPALILEALRKASA